MSLYDKPLSRLSTKMNELSLLNLSFPFPCIWGLLFWTDRFSSEIIFSSFIKDWRRTGRVGIWCFRWLSIFSSLWVGSLFCRIFILSSLDVWHEWIYYLPWPAKNSRPKPLVYISLPICHSYSVAKTEPKTNLKKHMR